MSKCTPEIKTPFCGKPGCEWPSPSGQIVAVSDDIAERLDEIADLAEIWKKHRAAGRSANAIRAAMIQVAREISTIEHAKRLHMAHKGE